MCVCISHLRMYTFLLTIQLQSCLVLVFNSIEHEWELLWEKGIRTGIIFFLFFTQINNAKETEYLKVSMIDCVWLAVFGGPVFISQNWFHFCKNATNLALSFIHTSQFFLSKFIPARFSLNPNCANLEANFPDVSSQNGRKQRLISAYFRFNLLLISIFSAALKENAN